MKSLTFLAVLLVALTACDSTRSERALEVATGANTTDVTDSPSRDTPVTFDVNLPQPDKDRTIATAEDIKHSLTIHQVGFSFVLDEKRYDFDNDRQLTDFVEAHKQRIARRKLTVVADANALYKSLVDGLDVLTVAKVDFQYAH